MQEVELSYKMLRGVDGYKSIEEIGSILEDVCTEEVEDIIIKDLPFSTEKNITYYLENVCILDREKQEYVVDDNTEKVFGIYLVTYDNEKDTFGLLYVSEGEVFTVFEPIYSDVDMKSTKLFCAFDDNDECVAQVYDDGNQFIDVTDTYAHELFKVGVYEFTAVNMLESSDVDSLFLYASVLEGTENGEQVESESFILRSKDEVKEFFNQIKQDIDGNIELNSLLSESEQTLVGLLRY